MVNTGVSYWFWIASIYLIYLVVQEIRKKDIDIKYNYIMVGISLSILSHIHISIWYLLTLIGVISLLNVFVFNDEFVEKYHKISLNWIMLGLGIISILNLIAFIVLTIITIVFMRPFSNKLKNGYVVFLSYIVTLGVVFRFY